MNDGRKEREGEMVRRWDRPIQVCDKQYQSQGLLLSHNMGDRAQAEVNQQVPLPLYSVHLHILHITVAYLPQEILHSILTEACGATIVDCRVREMVR